MCSGIIRVPVARLRWLIGVVRVVLEGAARLVVRRIRQPRLVCTGCWTAVRVEILVRSVWTIAGGRGVGGPVAVSVAGRISPATAGREGWKAHAESFGERRVEGDGVVLVEGDGPFGEVLTIGECATISDKEKPRETVQEDGCYPLPGRGETIAAWMCREEGRRCNVKRTPL